MPKKPNQHKRKSSELYTKVSNFIEDQVPEETCQQRPQPQSLSLTLPNSLKQQILYLEARRKRKDDLKWQDKVNKPEGLLPCSRQENNIFK